MENNPVKQQKEGIPGSTLKIIAIVVMFFDHIGAIIVEGYLVKVSQSVEGGLQAYVTAHPMVSFITLLDGILRLTGRIGFPLFAFLLIEGFTYTRNKWKYARNLLIFALVSEIPFNIGFKNKLFYPGYQNVFFTLLIGLLVLILIKDFAEDRVYSEWLSVMFYPATFIGGSFILYMIMKIDISLIFISIEVFSMPFFVISAVIGLVAVIVMTILFGKKWSDDQKNRYLLTVLFICAGVALAEVIHTDYSGYGVLTIVAMYFFRKKKATQFAVGCGVLTFYSIVEATAFFGLIPIAKYNGKRGLNLKYAFYAFYPIHILVIYAISYLVGISSFAIK